MTISKTKPSSTYNHDEEMQKAAAAESASSHGCSSCACSAPPVLATEAAPEVPVWRDLLSSPEVGISALLGLIAWALTHFVDGLIPSLIYATAIGVGGWSLFRGALKSLRRLSLDMNVLMTVAILGAAWLGDWAEAVSLIVLYAISERLEELSVRRSRRSLNALMTMAPAVVLMRRNGAEVEVAAGDVQVGEVFIVRSGERIALDGVVSAGSSDVNQASVTGESVPVEKTVGDEVFAGTLNTNRVLEVRAIRVAAEGTTSRIAHLVADAATQRSPRQRTIEKFAARYTPLVFVVAILVAAFQLMVFQVPARLAIEKSLALLVAACPCAFVISGPIATVCALSRAARGGVLIRGGATLETLANLRTIAFDKTGTLTHGTPRLCRMQTFGIEHERASQIAAALESRSEHPIAKAMVSAAQENPTSTRIEAHDFQEDRGLGISGTIEGTRYRIGRAQNWETLPPDVQRTVIEFESSGYSVALLGAGEQVLAVFGLQDTLRDEAPRVLEELRQQGVTQTVILSGDNKQSAERVATATSASSWFGALLPEDKLAKISDLTRRSPSAMVGDGINDAPALARADVGIAMGAGGSDAAIEAADVALLSNNLTRLPWTLDLAKRARRIVLQNIVLALGVKVLFVVGLFLGLWGDFALVGGVLADMGTTLIITANGLRLLRK